jgi:hypothetical protein
MIKTVKEELPREKQQFNKLKINRKKKRIDRGKTK